MSNLEAMKETVKIRKELLFYLRTRGITDEKMCRKIWGIVADRIASAWSTGYNKGFQTGMYRAGFIAGKKEKEDGR